MGTGAIGDENGALRPCRLLGRDDLAMGQVDRPRNMALGEESRTPHVKQHEVRALAQRVVNVPAVRFISKFGSEMATRQAAVGGRNGGQAQFLERPVRMREKIDIAPLLDRVRTDLSGRWTIARMAAECRMSPRTFLRRFNEATGAPPGEWLIAERLGAAKTLLRASGGSLDEVAAMAGLGSAYGLRRHFRRRLGISPSDYRARFMIERPVISSRSEIANQARRARLKDR